MSAASLQPDPAQALQHAQLLFSGQPTEYRLIHPRSGKIRSTWGHADTEDDFGELAEDNAEGYGVYAVVNALRPSVEGRIEQGKSARDADVIGVRSLFVELDKDEPKPGAHLAVLRAAPLPPSLIVRSSLPHKLHAYWLVDGVGVGEFATLQAALIGIFGGDPACKNLSRVMRVAGFFHTKGEPVLSTIVEASGVRYSRDEMLAAFPELGEALERERERQAARIEAQAYAAEKLSTPPDAAHASKYANRALQSEHDKVASAPDGERNTTLNKAAFALGQLVGAGALERGEVEDALTGAAQTCGLEPREAEATIYSGLEAGLKEPREIPEPKKKNWLEAKKGERAASGKNAKVGARPEIVVNGRWLREIVTDCLAALGAANEPPTLYMRGTIPARVNGDKIEALTATSLKGRLDRVADFVKVTFKPDKDGGEPVPETNPARPPADVAPDILTQTALPFPRLEEIVHAPVFLPNGALLAEDGYNLEHALLVRIKGLSELRANIPVAEALAMLGEVYSDFPFVEGAGRAHALAMTLQPFVRPLIQGATPMYLIDAPARGTGKGLLAEVMNLIPLGYVVPTMSQPRDGDELEKRLTSVLLEARPIVFLDNVTRLGSEALHAVLTSETWHGRILGKSETVTVPNRAVWLASGNNVELSDEMTRRVIPIRLDAGVERPEERTGFKHPDLPGYVRSHRSELVSACLSLVQAWVDAGMPKGTATLGRYESWAGVLGGILQVCGVCGFLEGRERLHSEADKETTEWAALCDRWQDAHGANLVTARGVFDVAREHTLLLDLWGGRTAQGALQRFGHALSSRRDRVFGGFVIRSAGRDTHAGSNAYRLERPPEKTPQTQQNPQPEVEAPSGTQAEPHGFSAGFEASPAQNPQNPPKPAQNPPTRNGVQDGTPGMSGDDMRDLRGFEPTRRKMDSAEDDDLSYLIGTTEGEL